MAPASSNPVGPPPEITKAIKRALGNINGIENFWDQVRRHSRNFNGVPKEHFGLFLKECEWRFNNPNPQNQLRQIKQWVKGCLS